MPANSVGINFTGNASDGAAPKRSAALRGVTLVDSDEEYLDNLSPTNCEILRAKGSYEEIASTLQIPVGTVRSRLSRAREALVRLREEQDGSANQPNNFRADSHN